MKHPSHGRYHHIALGGILTAVAVVALYFGAGNLDFSAAALAAFAVAMAGIEMGGKGAFLVYAAASVVAGILAPVKIGAILFACFFGHYPIFSAWLKTKKSGWVAFLIKILYFNFFFGAIIFLFAVFEFYPILWVFFFIAPTVVFIIYDFAMERILMVYLVKIKPRIPFPGGQNNQN